MRSILVLSLLLLGWSVAAQTPPPQMPPPPPATQAPPPTLVKPSTVKPPTVKGTKAKSSQNCRDATSGKFVTPAYAKQNPTTTVCETTK